VSDLLGLLQWGPAGWGDELARGLFITVSLSLATLPVGLTLGFFVALGRQSSDPLTRLSARIYATVFRGMPELLTLFVVYFGSQAAVSAVSNTLFGAPLEISPFVAGMVAFGLVLSGYAAEVFLSAFRGIPFGQYEAAHALGLTRWETLRLVIVPQLLRLALPGLANLWLTLLKDTALISVISLSDLLRQTTIAVGATKQPFFFYSVVCAIYLAIAIVSSFFISRADAWAARGTHR
jgi:polar amino acid transport system permease protein